MNRLARPNNPHQLARRKVSDLIKPLSSPERKVCHEAAVKLIKHLNKSKSEDEWDYAYNRLLKGLVSTKARFGFSMALAEVLIARKKQIDVASYLDKCEQAFTLEVGSTKNEERGAKLGRVFAMELLIKSPIMENADDGDIDRIIRTIIELSTSKNWIREPSFFTLNELFDDSRVAALEKSGLDIGRAAKTALELVHEHKLQFTSEGVAFYLTLGKRAQDIKVKDGWKANDPLAKGNIVTLAKCLKQVPVNDDEAQKGTWKKALHSVWNKVLIELCSSQADDGEEDEHRSKKHKSGKKSKSSKKDKSETGRISLEEFWTVTVDEGMFAASASVERKFWGFEIFSLFVEHVPDIKPLFTPNFMRSLMNQLWQQDNYLNKAAKRSIAALVAACKAQPRDRAAPAVRALMKAAPNFDQRTKTKAVEEILSVVPDEKVGKIVNTYIELFVNVSSDIEKPAQRRQWALDQLLNLVRVRGKTGEEWISKVVELLVKFGFFQGAAKEASPAISDDTSVVCQQRLNSVMAALVGLEREDEKTWPFFALEVLSSLQEKDELRISFEGELEAVKDKTVQTLEKIRQRRQSSRHADSTQLKAFELLFSLVLLQVYAADEDAVLMLEELQTCYNKILGQEKTRQGDADEDIDASMVLTEILLSLVSKKSQLLRRLSETVWETFTAQVSLESLGLLYDVLDQKENLQGQSDMFEVDGEEEEGEEGDEEEEVEEDGLEADDEEEDDEEEEDDDDDEEEEDEDEDEDEDIEMDDAERVARQKLADALGITESAEPASEQSSSRHSDDEESMDDEQMMALEGQLSSIFREQKAHASAGKQKKQDLVDAKQNVTHLKARVLDLLDIYIKKQSSNFLVLSAVVPLLRLMRTTKDRPLSDRAHNLLRTKLCKVKPMAVSNDDAEEVLQLLGQVHEEAALSQFKTHAHACNQASVFVTKVLFSHSSDMVEPVVAVYAQSLVEFVKKRSSKLTQGLFIDLVNWVTSTKPQTHK